ncbi:hypothetical protein EYF80_023510 [Liparis tanakae]|uniref:Uncharacterized protein n=1 Tax=Liparis tanakae TaxID=230148 RepID=A0A4Z2HKJ1_9TELE|nr:hypothetical protein EYF80_023510 [Liparis tanakae]
MTCFCLQRTQSTMRLTGNGCSLLRETTAMRTKGKAVGGDVLCLRSAAEDQGSVGNDSRNQKENKKRISWINRAARRDRQNGLWQDLHPRGAFAGDKDAAAREAAAAAAAAAASGRTISSP